MGLVEFCESLLEVPNDVISVFGANGKADSRRRDALIGQLGFGQREPLAAGRKLCRADIVARGAAVEDRDVGQAFTREGWANTTRQNELGRSFQADQARLDREFQADQAAERRAFAVNQALQNRG